MPICEYHNRESCKACLALKGALMFEKQANDPMTKPDEVEAKRAKLEGYLRTAVEMEAAGK